MSVTIVDSVDDAARLLADAPSPVIVVPVYDSYDDVACCVSAVAVHTEPSIAILIVDDGGTDRRVVELLTSASLDLGREVVILRHAQNEGYVRSCNDAFAATAGRDVVVLNSDVVVGAEWLERLTAAALSSPGIATASTLTNHGTIVSVPHRNHPSHTLPRHMSPLEASRAVAAGSMQIRPVLPTAIGHCMYLRRTVLDLVGCFDETFAPGYGEEVDFSQRAIALGFCHVLADDVFTFHRGASSFGDAPAVVERRAHHEALVRKRYPWYADEVHRVANDQASPLAHALANARRSLLGVTIGIDGLCLGPHRMGTQEVTMQTITALARRDDIARIVVFVPMNLPDYVVEVRKELSSVEFIGVNPYLGAPERVVDVMYRPCQVSEIVELDFMRCAGERFVVNQLDTIAFGNPAYFGSHDLWVRYRDVTRLTLELAHAVAYPSEFSHQSVVDLGLEVPGRPWAVVSCGIEPIDPTRRESRPASLTDDGPFLLCIGASYHHKNRRFALEVWAELRRRGWTGRIVLTGPTPPFGSSLASEAELLLHLPSIGADAICIGAVDDAEKHWLYRHASLVLYPSVVEGFGFVPFEAAQHDTATLSTRRGSLDEVLPTGIPVLDDFDVGAAADIAWELLHDADVRTRMVGALLERSAEFTWDATADKLMQLFRVALQQPRGRVLVLEGEHELPVGLASRSSREHGRAGSSKPLERLVSAVISRPSLKNGLSPDGSRRQRAARKVISHMRDAMRSTAP